MNAQVENKQRRTLSGRVVSDKMDKTVVVEVTRRVKHPQFISTLAVASVTRHTMRITSSLRTTLSSLKSVALFLAKSVGLLLLEQFSNLSHLGDIL
jgi:hypothetical protein